MIGAPAAQVWTFPAWNPVQSPDDKLWPWQEQIQLEIYASQAAILHPAIAAPFGTVHPVALLNASRFPDLRARAWTNATTGSTNASVSCGFLVLVNTNEAAPELFQLELTAAPPTAASDSVAVRLFDAGYTKTLLLNTATRRLDDTNTGAGKLLEDWVGPGEVNIYMLGSPTACARLKTDDAEQQLLGAVADGANYTPFGLTSIDPRVYDSEGQLSGTQKSRGILELKLPDQHVAIVEADKPHGFSH